MGTFLESRTPCEESTPQETCPIWSRWNMAVDETKYKPLNRSGIGIYLVNLTAGSMLAPPDHDLVILKKEKAEKMIPKVAKKFGNELMMGFE